MRIVSNKKRIVRNLRRKRIRRIVSGTPERPRLSVFKSAQHIYAQLVDDTVGKSLVSASSLKLAGKSKMTKKDVSKEIGKTIAKKAIEKGISKVTFDRSGYHYHGRIKALAEGAREAGLEF